MALYGCGHSTCCPSVGLLQTQSRIRPHFSNHPKAGPGPEARQDTCALEALQVLSQSRHHHFRQLGAVLPGSLRLGQVPQSTGLAWIPLRSGVQIGLKPTLPVAMFIIDYAVVLAVEKGGCLNIHLTEIMNKFKSGQKEVGA